MKTKNTTKAQQAKFKRALKGIIVDMFEGIMTPRTIIQESLKRSRDPATKKHLRAVLKQT